MTNPYTGDFPSKVIDGKIYDPKTSELVQYLHDDESGHDHYLFMKPSGELFVIELTHRFFFVIGKMMMQRYLRIFDADAIPEKALIYHGIKE